MGSDPEFGVERAEVLRRMSEATGKQARLFAAMAEPMREILCLPEDRSIVFGGSLITIERNGWYTLKVSIKAE